jgi:hypothetical protein
MKDGFMDKAGVALAARGLAVQQKSAQHLSTTYVPPSHQLQNKATLEAYVAFSAMLAACQYDHRKSSE